MMQLSPCDCRVNTDQKGSYLCRHPKVHATANLVDRAVCAMCQYCAAPCPRPWSIEPGKACSGSHLPPIVAEGKIMDTFASGQEYISCPWIEGGLVFGQGMFHVCCIAHHEAGGWMPIAPFDQNSTVPLAAVRQVRDELRRANQRDGHERCRGCANLRRQRWTPRHVFDTLNFSHFTQCNLECGYCYLQSFAAVKD